MGKLQEWRIKREAKRLLLGKKTFSKWLQDKLILFYAKKEIKKLRKQQSKESK